MKTSTKAKLWIALVCVVLIAVGALWLYFAHFHETEEQAERDLATPAEHSEPEFDPNAKPGVNFANELANILEEQLDRGITGWRPNNILIGGVLPLDNVENYQLGVRDIVLKATDVLNERLAKKGGGADEFDRHVKIAKEKFSYEPTSYMIPDTDKEYQTGVDSLRAYAEKLKDDTSDFQARSDNLAALLSALRRELASADQALIKTEEDDGSPVSMFDTDDYYYHAKGKLHASYRLCRVIAVEFDDVLRSKNGIKIMNELIQSLEHGDHDATPWIVLDGGPTSLRANHRRYLAAYTAEAQLKIVTLEENLAK